jgi:hypothetical protein
MLAAAAIGGINLNIISPPERILHTAPVRPEAWPWVFLIGLVASSVVAVDKRLHIGFI